MHEVYTPELKFVIFGFRGNRILRNKNDVVSL